jgi:transposase InsO family protein
VSRTDVTRASTVHRAVRPNQVWSWDITWLPTNIRGIYLHLYLMMDVWSRRIVGWRIADGDSAEIAANLITQACRDGDVDPRGLVLHSDNGKPMRANTMIATLGRRHQLYERERRSKSGRWVSSTRNFSPIGLVVLNPPKAVPDAVP